jgi:hypothetical protein
MDFFPCLNKAISAGVSRYETNEASGVVGCGRGGDDANDMSASASASKGSGKKEDASNERCAVLVIMNALPASFSALGQ